MTKFDEWKAWLSAEECAEIVTYHIGCGDRCPAYDGCECKNATLDDCREAFIKWANSPAGGGEEQ